MKTKKKLITLMLSALLTVGLSNMAANSYAGDKEDKAAKAAEKAAEDAAKAAADKAAADKAAADAAKAAADKAAADKAAADKAAADKEKEDKEDAENGKKSCTGTRCSSGKIGDSDKRSLNDSGIEKNQKVTICHVPPGNPRNAHTIHISSNAWPAHDKNHPGDYLGSCNREAAYTKERVTPANGSTPAKRTWTTPTVSTSNTTKETQHTITGCSSTYLTPLRKAVRDFYEPVVVPDSALDDPTVAMAVSQCLDNGDSSDSSDDKKSGKNGRAKGDSNQKNKKDSDGRKVGGKGQARDSVHDSVSDSGNTKRKTHYIRGCQNRDTTKKADSFHKHDSGHHHDSGNKDSGGKAHRADSHSIDLDKNYRLRLKDVVDAYLNLPDSQGNNHTGRSSKVGTTKASVDAKTGDSFGGGKEGKRGHVVSDSAMDDSGVKAAVKACASKPDSHKIDSSKIGKKRGDSGHKYRVVKSCGTRNDTALDNAIKAYQAKESTAPVVLEDSILTDASVKSYYDDCMSHGGKDSTTPATTDVTISNGTIGNATITDRTITGATVTGGETSGTKVTPVSGNSTTTTGATIYGVGTASQIIVGGTTTGGSVALTYTTEVATGSGSSTTTQTVTAETTGGTISGGTASGGTITEGTITTGSATAGTGDSAKATPVTDATITDGTLTGGTVTGGTLSNGTATGGTATVTSGSTVTTTGGIVTGGTVTGGSTTGTGANAITTGATVTGGTVTGGTTTGLTITGSTVTGVIVTGATVTGASVTGGTVVPGSGTSGQINWRELSQ